MSERPSRRDVLRKGIAAGAVFALPSLGASQETQQEPIDTREVEKQLAKPLPDEIRKVLESSLRQVGGYHRARLSHKLPENSEPCVVYHATPAQRRRR